MSVDASVLRSILSTEGFEAGTQQALAYREALQTAKDASDALAGPTDKLGKAHEDHAAKASESTKSLHELGAKAQELAGEQIPGLSNAIHIAADAIQTMGKASESGVGQLALLGTGIAGIGVAAAGISFHSFETGIETLHLTALQTGLTTTAIAGLNAELESIGQPAGSADRALMRVNLGLQTMQQELDAGKPLTGNLAKAFADLGVQAQGADGNIRPLAELLPSIADAFQQGAERAKGGGEAFNAAGLAAQLFGARLGPQLVPLLEQGSAGLQNWTDKAKTLGLGSEEQVAHIEAFKQKSAELHLELQALGASIGSDVAPTFTAIVGGVTAATDALNKLPGPVKDLVVTLPLLAGGTLLGASALLKLGEGAMSTLGSLTSLVGGSTAVAASETAAAAGVLEFEAATGAAVAPTEALAVAQGGLAAAAGSAAATGGAAAIALGPIGLIAVAAGLAIQHLSQDASDLDGSLHKLHDGGAKEATDGLNKLLAAATDLPAKLQTAYTATYDLGIKLAEEKDQLEGLYTALAKSNDAHGVQSQQSKSLRDEITKLKEEIAKLQGQYDATHKALAALNTEWAKSPLNQVTTEVEKTTDATRYLSDAIDKDRAAQGRWMGQIGEASAAAAGMKDHVDTMAASLGLSTAGLGSHAGALGLLNTAVTTASKSTQDAAVFQHDWAGALAFAGLSASDQRAKIAGLDDIIKNSLDPSQTAAVTSTKALYEAVATLGPAAAETARQAQALSDAFTEAKDNGDWGAMLTAFQGELGNADIKVKKLHDDWAGMLHIPSQEELDVKAKIADVTLTIDQLHAALSNSSPAARHVADLQRIYDQSVLTGAKMSDQTKAKATLDLALSQTGPAGADAAATQIRLDQLEPTRKGLQDQLTPLVDAKNATEAHALAVAAGNPHFDHQLAVMPPLAVAIGSTVQPAKDAKNATEGFTTASATAGRDVPGSLKPIATAWDDITAKIDGSISKLGSFGAAVKNLGPTIAAGIAAAGAGVPGSAGGGILSPVAQLGSDVAVTQKFGVKGEQGVDFGIPTVGSPLISGGPGIVTKVTNEGQGGIGLSVTIKLDSGFEETIGHLDKALVSVGDKIAAGVTVGLSGGEVGSPTSGVTTGPHTEIQIRNPAGQLVDPLTLLGPGGGLAGAAGGPVPVTVVGGSIGGLPPAWYAAIQAHESTLPLPSPGDNEPMFGFAPGALNSVGSKMFKSGGTAAGSAGVGAPAGYTNQSLFPSIAAGVGSLDAWWQRYPDAVAAANAGDFNAFLEALKHHGYAGPGEWLGTATSSKPTLGTGNPAAFAGTGTPGTPGTFAPGAAGSDVNGQLPSPAPETPVSIDAAAETARKALVTLGTEWNDVNKGIVNGVQTVTDATLAGAKTQADADHDAALAAISEAGRANQQVLDDIQNNVEPATLKADQDIAKSANDAAGEKTAAWRKSAGEYDKDLTANTQQTQAADAASVQSAIDADNGKRALSQEYKQFFEVLDLGTAKGHEQITEQTAIHDQAVLDRTRQTALGGIGDQITAQGVYNDAVQALDDAKARHLVGNDLQVYQSAVDIAQKRLGLAQTTANDEVAIAQKAAQDLIAANKSVLADYETGINAQISLGNAQYAIQLQLADPNVVGSQRAALQHESDLLPGLMGQQSQLTANLAQLRTQQQFAPAGSDQAHQLLQSIGDTTIALNLTARAITALGTAAGIAGTALSAIDIKTINAGLSGMGLPGGGPHIMQADEVPSAAVAAFWEAFGRNQAALAAGEPGAGGSVAASVLAGMNATSPAALKEQQASDAVVNANGAVAKALTESQPFLTAQTTATELNTAALNANTSAMQGGAGTGGPFPGGMPSQQGGAGTGITVPDPALSEHLTKTIGTALEPVPSMVFDALDPVPSMVYNALSPGGSAIPGAVSASVSGALAPANAAGVAAATAQGQAAVTQTITTAQGVTYSINASGMVATSATALGSGAGDVSAGGKALAAAAGRIGTGGAGGGVAGLGGTAPAGIAQDQYDNFARQYLAIFQRSEPGLWAAAVGTILKQQEDAVAAAFTAAHPGVMRLSGKDSEDLNAVLQNTAATAQNTAATAQNTGRTASSLGSLGGSSFGPEGRQSGDIQGGFFASASPSNTNVQLATIAQNTSAIVPVLQETQAAVQDTTAAVTALSQQQQQTNLYIDSYLIGSAAGRAIQRKISLNLRPIVRFTR